MSDDWVATVTTKFSREKKVHLQHLTGFEELGRPFRYELELIADDMDLSLDAQLGEPVTVKINNVREQRFFNGIVHQISFVGVEGNYARYMAHVRPSFWFLKHSSDNRIFQNSSALEIIEQILDANGVAYKLSLNATYRERDYCVQYGETDFDFISRLLEEEGMYYFFDHADGQHDMVIADHPGAHSARSGYEKVKYYPPGESRDEDHLSTWELSHQVDTQKFTINSYNYEKSRDSLKAEIELAPGKHGQDKREQYEYGQLYPKLEDAKQLVEVRIQEQQANYAIASGSGNVLGLSCGYVFELTQFPRSDQNAKHLVIGATYEFENNEIDSGAAARGASFSCFVHVIRDTVPFRPARVTPKALVSGPQTATVVGKNGEEIWTDKFGRVKVQFHWDRQGKKDENTTCWVRVSTALAGENWGFVAIPRIGQEVIVDFLEGDPDQPIITGSVYNDAHMPPYKLPENQTQSGIKTRSSKEGNQNTFNEFRFEDKKGKEEVYLHAERNFRRVVESDEIVEIGLDAAKKGTGNLSVDIYSDRTVLQHEGDDKHTIEKGNQSVTLQKGNQETLLEKGDQDIKLASGNQSIDVSDKIDIKAGDQLTITVGQSKLVMKKDGTITLQGKDITVKAMKDIGLNANMNIKLNAKMKLDVKGALAASVKGMKVDVAGDTMLNLKAGALAKLKGGMTMIG